MQGSKWYTPLKVVGYIVLGVMAVSLAYAGYISLANYAGIGV